MEINGEDWIPSAEAIEILSRNHGRQVAGGYLRKLAHAGKLRAHYLDGRTPLYLRGQVEVWHIADHPGRPLEDNPSSGAARARRSRARRARTGAQSSDERPHAARLARCRRTERERRE